MAHSTFAALQLDEGFSLVDQVLEDPETAAVSPKMRALLAIAAHVQAGGRQVTDDDVARARTEGATDVEIHDAVLIAAAFCMFNRYVDGLGTWAPPERADYEANGRMIVDGGYVNSLAH
jgi:alkylhydroperoxidase family enzyme